MPCIYDMHFPTHVYGDSEKITLQMYFENIEISYTEAELEHRKITYT